MYFLWLVVTLEDPAVPSPKVSTFISCKKKKNQCSSQLCDVPMVRRGFHIAGKNSAKVPGPPQGITLQVTVSLCLPGSLRLDHLSPLPAILSQPSFSCSGLGPGTRL